MQIYLLRHGIAQAREEPDCPPDPERDLTSRGIRRTMSALQGLRWLGVEIAEVWTSPYLRCRHTAELAAQVLRTPPPQVEESLAPGRAIARAFDVIAQRATPSVLVCGHAPDLDRLAGYALTGEDVLITTMKKAGCACIALEAPPQPGGLLRWLLEPTMLRRLGGDED